MHLNLEQKTAHKITTQTIDGTDYLLIEAGGFSPKKPAGWKSPLLILQKQYRHIP